MDELSNKQVVINGLMLVIGTFLLALCYNLFLLPNNFAFAGMSGLAIVINKITGFNPTVFIYIANITLLIMSFIFLDWDKTKNTIVGSLLYPLMITFTLPIANFLLTKAHFTELIITSVLAAIFYGVSNGLIYKGGFTTGGNDVLMQILNKYLHVPESQGLTIVNGIVISCCLFVFGIEIAIYSFIIMLIGSYFIDRIIYGISDSKLFYIFTRKPNIIKKTVLNEFGSGFTVLPTRGGYSHNHGSLIMVAIASRDYYKLKQKILEIDPEAFFIIESCYEVKGGVKRSNLPFIN